MNLLQETLKMIDEIIAENNNDISWAKIHTETSFVNDIEKPNESFILRPNHTEQEKEDFFRLLNFEYDEGYGGQLVYGVIVFNDGIWMSRGEYDGSEWWEYNKCPKWKEED